MNFTARQGHLDCKVGVLARKGKKKQKLTILQWLYYYFCVQIHLCAICSKHTIEIFYVTFIYKM